MTEEEATDMRGRLAAMEAVTTHIVWQMALHRPHPPTALAMFLKPLLEQMAAMAANPALDPATVSAATRSIREMAETLEEALHAAALERAGPGSKGNA